MLVRNKYLIVTSNAFLLQNGAFKRSLLCLYALQLLWKKILRVMRYYSKLANSLTDSNWLMNKNASFFQLEQLPKIFLSCFSRATALYNLGIVAILLANLRKSLKFYCFESVQDLVSFFDLDFFRLFWVYFAAEAGIVFNLFLNFEQK